MKKKYFIFLIILIFIYSCKTISFSESELTWKKSFGQVSYQLVVINDSIFYGYKGGENYFLGSCLGENISVISKKNIEFFLKDNNESPKREIIGNKHIKQIATTNQYQYSIIDIDYDRLFRWQKYDKKKLIITRKIDNKKLELKFNISEFRGVYQIIPLCSNKLVISYNTYDAIGNKIGLINIDELFKCPR